MVLDALPSPPTLPSLTPTLPGPSGFGGPHGEADGCGSWEVFQEADAAGLTELERFGERTVETLRGKAATADGLVWTRRLHACARRIAVT